MQCEYKATQKFNLRMHVQLKHEGFVYSCDQCDYKASYKHAFRIHKQSIHEDIKFDCEQCQGGRTWQPFVGSKNGSENFRLARIYNFRAKCVVFARNRKFAKLTQ